MIDVRETENMGMGVFATEFIPKNTLIIESPSILSTPWRDFSHR